MITHPAIAIRITNDKFPMIITGYDYDKCQRIAEQLGYVYDMKSVVEGFLTDDYRFLDKFNAKPEARKCGQLKHDNGARELLLEEINLNI